MMIVIRNKFFKYVIVLSAIIAAFAAGLSWGLFVSDNRLAELRTARANLINVVEDNHRRSMVTELRNTQNRIEILESLDKAAMRGQSIYAVLSEHKLQLQKTVTDMVQNRDRWEKAQLGESSSKVITKAQNVLSEIEMRVGP